MTSSSFQNPNFFGGNPGASPAFVRKVTDQVAKFVPMTFLRPGTPEFAERKGFAPWQDRKAGIKNPLVPVLSDNGGELMTALREDYAPKMEDYEHPLLAANALAAFKTYGKYADNPTPVDFDMLSGYQSLLAAERNNPFAQPAGKNPFVLKT